MSRSWNEIQALASRAAAGAGVPPAQAMAFGTMLVRHLADGGAEGPLVAALETPARILDLALRVERIIESASVAQDAVSQRVSRSEDRALMVSWIYSLPCKARVELNGETLHAELNLRAPGLRQRPDRVMLSAALYDHLDRLAARTYVPDSDASRAMGAGVGAGAMDTDRVDQSKGSSG